MNNFNNKSIITIFPGFNALYYTYYILGLQRLFPEVKIRFENIDFPLRKLRDRAHIHYVDGSEETIQTAMNTILKDQDYRKYLETNARQYYEDYLSPEKVISRLLFGEHHID